MLDLLAPPNQKNMGEPLLLIIYLCLLQHGWKISHAGSHKSAFFKRVVASFVQKNGNPGHPKADALLESEIFMVIVMAERKKSHL